VKLLLSAYACQPNKGSEPGVGWNLACELARSHDVWVITRNENRMAIEQELARAPIPALHVVYYDLPYLVRWWNKDLRGVHIHYHLWQLGIYRLARDLHRTVGFDVAQHLTYVRHSSPSLISLLPIPFVWGPVGGADSTPRSFRKTFSLHGRVHEWLRAAFRALGERDPLVHLTARRSALAQATTPATADRLRQLGADAVQVCSEVAFSDRQLAELAEPQPVRHPLTFISIGRLLCWKGFHLGLQAFALAGLDWAEYWIIGDGPERRRLNSLARSLGVDSRVRFLGALPRQEALLHLKQSSALVHPSLHDSGGWVCLEAMAAGKPVICLDLAGPATQITPEAGFRIPAHTPEQAVRDLAGAMTMLASDEQLRIRKGAAAQQHVRRHYRCETRAQALSNLYADLVRRAGTRNAPPHGVPLARQVGLEPGGQQP